MPTKQNGKPQNLNMNLIKITAIDTTLIEGPVIVTARTSDANASGNFPARTTLPHARLMLGGFSRIQALHTSHVLQCPVHCFTVVPIVELAVITSIIHDLVWSVVHQSILS